jgi:hypothetical protein
LVYQSYKDAGAKRFMSFGLNCGVEEKTMKIYVRERQKVGEGVESPKYRIVAVTGGQLQIEATHFRKFEIEQIAKDVGAEVVFMKPVADEHKKKH